MKLEFIIGLIAVAVAIGLTISPKNLIAGSKFPKHELPGYVVRVIDGDSLIADVAGRGQLEIRLAYIDTPEYNQPGGRSAKAYMTRLVNGKSVELQLQNTDRYGRVISVVSAGNVQVNAEMVRRGHAWAYEQYIPAQLRAYYMRLQQQARRAKAGLWGLAGTPIAPWEWRRSN